MSTLRLLGIIFTSLGGLAEIATMFWCVLQSDRIIIFEAQRRQIQNTTISLLVVSSLILVGGLVLLFLSRRKGHAVPAQTDVGSKIADPKHTGKSPARPFNPKVRRIILFSIGVLACIAVAFFGFRWAKNSFSESQARKAVESLLAQQSTPAKLLGWRGVIEDGSYRIARATIVLESDTLEAQFTIALLNRDGWAIIGAESPGGVYLRIEGSEMFPLDLSRVVPSSIAH